MELHGLCGPPSQHFFLLASQACCPTCPPLTISTEHGQSPLRANYPLFGFLQRILLPRWEGGRKWVESRGLWVSIGGKCPRWVCDPVKEPETGGKSGNAQFRASWRASGRNWQFETKRIWKSSDFCCLAGIPSTEGATKSAGPAEKCPRDVITE